MQSPASPSSHRAFSSFPSTSLSSPSRSSPYVTDQPLSQLNASLGGRPISSSSSTFTGGNNGTNGREAVGSKAEGAEVLYEAPENGLEIEVRDPRTQGKLTSLLLDQYGGQRTDQEGETGLGKSQSSQGAGEVVRSATYYPLR